MKAVLFIALGATALGATLAVAGAADAGERGHAYRNAAAGYARQAPMHPPVQARVESRSYYSDTGWQGGYGPVQSYGYGYGHGGAGGYAPPIVIAPQEPIRSGWSGPAPRATPFGYPVQGYGRDYYRAPYAPWAPYGQGQGQGYGQGYEQGYGQAYGQSHSGQGGYSYESRTYVEDGGNRYGWSGGQGCGRCDPRPPSYQPYPIHVQGPPVRVQAPPVYVQAPPVYVYPSPVYVEPSVVNVQAPPVYVAATDVRVAAPQVNVAPSQVHMAPPNVDVAPPDVRFDAPAPGYGGYYAVPEAHTPPPPPPPHHRSPTERPYHGYAQEPGERG